MRKYIVTVCLLSFLCSSSYSQTDEMVQRHADSLKKVLRDAKGDAKIDCLNVLASDYFWLDDGPDKLFDTGYVFAGQAYKEAKTSNYKRGLGYACIQMGSSYGQRMDDDRNNNNSEANYIQAVKYLKQAIEIGEEINDYNMAGDVYSVLRWMEKWKGDSGKYKNDLEKAIYYYEKSKKLQKDIYNELTLASCPGCNGNEKLLADLYADLANIYVAKNNSTAAEEQLNKAIVYYQKLGNKNALGWMYHSLSDTYFHNHDYKNSEDASFKSLSYFREANDKDDEIFVMTELCKIYEIPGDFENGIEYCKKSIQLAEELLREKPKDSESKRYWGQAFFWMARLYLLGGDYQTAMDIMRTGHNYYPVDSTSQAFWSATIGDVHRLTGNYDSAMYYLKPFAISAQIPNNFGKVSLGNLYVDLKNYDKALELMAPFTLLLKKRYRIIPPLANGLMIIADAYIGKENYQAALPYAREALIDL